MYVVRNLDNDTLLSEHSQLIDAESQIGIFTGMGYSSLQIQQRMPDGSYVDVE
jgi:hypothetical protein